MADEVQRILHVDDNPDEAELIHFRLSRVLPNCQVDSCYSVADALNLLKSKSYNCVLSDYQMPGADGLDFLNQLRQINNDIPFIIITGHGNEDIAAEAFRRGADDYFVKGYGDHDFALIAKGIKKSIDIYEERTKRKITERELEKFQEIISMFFNSTSDGIFLFDDDLNFIDVNSKSLEIIHKKRQEVIGKNLSDIFPEAIPSGRYEKYMEVIRTGVPYTVEHYLPPSGLAEGIFFVRAFKVGNGLGVVFTDITQVIEAEQKLKESEQRFHAVLNNSFQLTGLLDKQGHLLISNKTALDFIGADESEVNGKLFWETPWWNFSSEIQNTIKNAIDKASSGEFVRFETQHVSKTGEPHEFDFSLTPVRDEHGEVAFLIPEGRDITDLHKIQIELDATKNLLRTAVEQTSAGVIVADAPDGNIVIANSAALDIIGGKHGDSGKTHAEKQLDHVKFLRPDGSAYSREEWPLTRAFKSGKETVNEEAIMERPDGEYRWVLINAAPVRDDSGALKAGVVVFSDITDQKRTEQKIRESELRYRTLFDAAGDGILLMKDQKIIDCNQQFQDMIQITREEAIGMHPGEFSPEEQPDGSNSHEKAAEHINRALERGTVSFEWLHKRTNGEEFYADIILNSLVLGGEKHLLAHMRDISENKNLRVSLERSERVFRQIVEEANIPILVTVDEKIVYVNKYIENMTGSMRETIIGNRVGGNVHPDDRHIVVDRYIKALKGEKWGDSVLIRNRLRDSDKTIWLNLVNYLQVDWGGKIGLIIFMDDLTDRINAQAEVDKHRERLVHADRLASLGTLVSGVAHEINNPNNYIMLNATFMRDLLGDLLKLSDKQIADQPDLTVMRLPYKKARTKAIEICDAIADGSNRINHIISELRSFARQAPPEKVNDVDVRKVIDRSVVLLGNLISKSTEKFELHLDEDLQLISADPQRLEQVLVNLLQNACQALTDKKQRIHVSANNTEDRKAIQIIVSDEGTGIDEEHLKHILDPFFTTKRDSGGSGLGLSVSNSIVQDHGGTLEFRSKRGKGTTATITLPVQ